MAISRDRKKELLVQYKEWLEDSKAVFFTEYSGIDVKTLQSLRNDLRQVDGTISITKNTLMRLALEETGRPAADELLNGQVAASFAAGEAPPLAKALVNFAKKNDNLVIRGGIFGDSLLSANDVENLAKLPSLDELRAQLAGLVSTPARNLASVVASGVRQVVNVLDAYAKLEDAADAGA